MLIRYLSIIVIILLSGVQRSCATSSSIDYLASFFTGNGPVSSNLVRRRRPSRVARDGIDRNSQQKGTATTDSIIAHDDISQHSKSCQDEEDLDSVHCHLEDLSSSTLKSICTRMGIDVDRDIFISSSSSKQLRLRPTHGDFVQAARQCLATERDLLKKGGWASLADGDPENVAQLWLLLAAQNPIEMDRIQKDMKELDPALWEDLKQLLGTSPEPAALAAIMTTLND